MLCVSFQCWVVPFQRQPSLLLVSFFVEWSRHHEVHGSKGKSEKELVMAILKAAREHPELQDEIYYQLVKQTTSNKSSKNDSCERGWKLLVICTGYLNCSELLLPYLLSYLQANSSDSKREFHAMASMCDSNLRKTVRYGGRKNPPGEEEIEAIIVGRFVKRQVIHLPGDDSKVLRVRICTTSYDLLKELCTMLNLLGESDIEEFGIHADLGKHTLPLPLSPHEYVQDVCAMLDSQNLNYKLCFQKLMWFNSWNLENSLYSSVLYHQAVPDFMRAHLVQLDGGVMSQQLMDTVCLLAALQHRARGETDLPSLKQTAKLIPPSVS
ncbi:unconventional myosin-XV-like isoform X1 [Dysidea avara]|uniref:unconventional myosin-XV-like isoform X1 n=2 Tax=Dysidea avara TaxID=196820 RepID=UPI00332CF0D8